MGNILLLTSQYTGAANANGICARNIAVKMKKMGHDITVVCYENEIEENDVYMIQKSTSSKRSIGSKICHIIKNYFCIDINKEDSRNFKKKTLELCLEKKIDMIICFFFPLETITVLEEVKNLYPDIITVIYELDSIGDGIFAASKLRFVAKLAYEKWCTDSYAYADSIVVMKNHEKYWQNVWGKKFGNKLMISDIPVMTEKRLSVVNESKQSTNTFLYAGLLEKKYRSPEYFLRLMLFLSVEKSIEIEFYTKGDCEDIISEKCKTHNNIHQCGYVPQVVLESALANADFLVSIGNKVSNSVPSKLITYLSYGKPIIHIASQKNDVCVSYLDKYPLGLVLYEKDSIEKNAKVMGEFITKMHGKKIDYNKIESLFKMNTPQYSAALLSDILRK